MKCQKYYNKYEFSQKHINFHITLWESHHFSNITMAKPSYLHLVAKPYLDPTSTASKPYLNPTSAASKPHLAA